jgi:low affinity Fe/Cu permease
MQRDSGSPMHKPRTRMSRWADGVSDALGHEAAFAVASVGMMAWLVVGVWVGLHLVVVTSVVTLITFIMVFALQHTSSRESRALNLKLDELIRVSEARNDLIGAENEGHDTLDQRRQELLKRRE